MKKIEMHSPSRPCLFRPVAPVRKTVGLEPWKSWQQITLSLGPTAVMHECWHGYSLCYHSGRRVYSSEHRPSVIRVVSPSWYCFLVPGYFSQMKHLAKRRVNKSGIRGSLNHLLDFLSRLPLARILGFRSHRSTAPRPFRQGPIEPSVSSRQTSCRDRTG